MSQPDLRDLVEELQNQLAFQDDTLHALNAALADQQRVILTLQRQLTLLKSRQDEQAAALAELPGGQAQDERPPHY